jgi:hypothetical protein
LSSWRVRLEEAEREKGGVEREGRLFLSVSLFFSPFFLLLLLADCSLLFPSARPYSKPSCLFLRFFFSSDLFFLFRLELERGENAAERQQSPMPRGPFPEARATRRP